MRCAASDIPRRPARSFQVKAKKQAFVHDWKSARLWKSAVGDADDQIALRPTIDKKLEFSADWLIIALSALGGMAQIWRRG